MANPLAHLYSTVRWHKIRRHQMRIEPLCRFCSAKGLVVSARVCDHITPHRGDMALFWAGPFQSLCPTCHSSVKQSMESSGGPTLVGVDGWAVSDALATVPASPIYRSL